LHVSAIIPAHNEAGGIAEVIRAVDQRLRETGAVYEIIVVDDGSTDGTLEQVQAVADSVEAVRLAQHAANRGYGAALKTGLLSSSYDRILITDGDQTYPDDKIPTLVGLSRQYDMVVGDRTGPGNHVPLARRPAKYVLGRLAEFLSNRKIPDLNSGLRIFKKEIAQKFYPMLPDGFSFTSTITLACLQRGYTIKYVPIQYHKRKGKSKIRPIRDTLMFLNLILRIVLYLNPLRVFLPLSLSCFAVSLSLYVLRVAWGGGFLVTTIISFVCGFQLLVIGLLADLIDKRLS
jgi:glycosyltransferase involved in cell wall biosynthesis